MIIGHELGERVGAALRTDWIPDGADCCKAPASDPILHRSPETEALYDAQCWWLVHLSLLDRVLDRAMPHYLQRLLMGESQQAAYAATFGMPIRAAR